MKRDRKTVADTIVSLYINGRYSDSDDESIECDSATLASTLIRSIVDHIEGTDLAFNLQEALERADFGLHNKREAA